MRVIIDSNVIISAALFKSKVMSKVMRAIATNHHLVLTNSIIDEVKAVVSKKFPARLSNFENFFASLDFEYQHLPSSNFDNIQIRDKNDKHIIASALITNAEVLITGDEDFFDYEYEDLEILRPSDFLEKYEHNYL